MRAAVPVVLGYLGIGIAAGVVERAAWSAWAVANVAGAALSGAARDTRTLAFALPAMFAGLLVLQVRIQPRLREALGVALFSGAAGAGIQLAAPGPGAVIGATVLGATLGLALERWKSGPNSSR